MSKTGKLPFSPDLAAFVGLLVLPLLAHAVSLSNPFYMDDFAVLANNAWLKQGPAPGGWFGTFFFDRFQTFPGYRPLLMLSFWMNAKLSGLSPPSLRAGNLLLHTANGFLLYVWIRTVTREPMARWAAFFCAALFLLHPAQTLALNMVWKRSSIFEATFILAALAVHAHERLRPAYRARIVLLEFLLTAAACLSKESGLLVLPLLFLCDVVSPDRSRIFRNRSTWALYASLLALGIAFYELRFHHIDAWLGANRRFVGERAPHTAESYFIHSVSVLPKYLYLSLVPDPRILDDPELPAGTPWAAYLLVSASLALSVLLAVRFRTRPVVAAALGLFWLPLLTFLGPVQVFFPMDPIRLYLPLAGFSILLVLSVRSALGRLGGRASVRRVIFRPEWALLLLCLSWGTHSFLQNRRYADPVRIWSDFAAEYPGSDLAWGELGVALEGAGENSAAALAFASAVKLNPQRKAYLVRVFRNLDLAGQPIRDALPVLMGLPADEIPAPEVLVLASLLEKKKETRRALELYVNAVSRNPTYGPAWLSLAHLLETQGRSDKAAEYYRAALNLMPGDSFATAGLRRTERAGRAKP